MHQVLGSGFQEVEDLLAGRERETSRCDLIDVIFWLNKKLRVILFKGVNCWKIPIVSPSQSIK